jgi:hypothetical protein
MKQKVVITRLAERVPGLRQLAADNKNLETDRGVLQLEKGQLEAQLREARAIADDPRALLARHFIKGHGIEIGAAQYPVTLPPKAKVRYVDLFDEKKIREIWPIYKKVDIVHVDVVDDAEKLTKFKAGSLDFIIANHFFEHCIDPIGTLITMYKKLAKQGVLFFAIPDMRYTFDSKRPLTSYEHLLDEHHDTTKKYLWEHTVEFFTIAEPYKGDIEARAREVIASGFRIHYHVWTSKELLELFTRVAVDFKLHLEIKALFSHSNETIFILQKTA